MWACGYRSELVGILQSSNQSHAQRTPMRQMSKCRGCNEQQHISMLVTRSSWCLLETVLQRFKCSWEVKPKLWLTECTRNWHNESRQEWPHISVSAPASSPSTAASLELPAALPCLGMVGRRVSPGGDPQPPPLSVPPLPLVVNCVRWDYFILRFFYDFYSIL